MEKLAADLGVKNHVHFLGCIPQEQVRDVLFASDCFLIASDFEGSSISLMEAMYNSLPIIASDVPGVKDMVTDGENALLFPCRDSTALNACIQRFRNNPELARACGMHARISYEEKYSFDLVRQTYLEAL